MKIKTIEKKIGLYFALELMIFVEVLHQLLVQLFRGFIAITHDETFNAVIANRYQVIANALKVSFNLIRIEL